MGCHFRDLGDAVMEVRWFLNAALPRTRAKRKRTRNFSPETRIVIARRMAQMQARRAEKGKAAIKRVEEEATESFPVLVAMSGRNRHDRRKDRRLDHRIEERLDAKLKERVAPDAKPIDRWLTLATGAVAIAFWLLPKTRLTIIAALGVMFGLLFHPIWNSSGSSAKWFDGWSHLSFVLAYLLALAF